MLYTSCPFASKAFPMERVPANNSNTLIVLYHSGAPLSSKTIFLSFKMF
nr:MAG TPA: hypothetical protein [Caudoviricetes sp.]